MPTPFQSALAEISEEFAQRVIELVRSALVAELGNLTLPDGPAPAVRARAAAPKRAARRAAPKAASKAAPKAARLERRTSESIAKTLDDIAALLQKQPGLGSEEIQKTLGLARNEVGRPIALGLSSGVLHKTGEKRATKYFPGGSGGGAAPKRSAKKSAGGTKSAKRSAKRSAEETAPASDAT